MDFNGLRIEVAARSQTASPVTGWPKPPGARISTLRSTVVHLLQTFCATIDNLYISQFVLYAVRMSGYEGPRKQKWALSRTGPLVVRITFNSIQNRATNMRSIIIF